MSLIEIGDELALAKHFTGCIVHACQSIADRGQRAAICAVAAAARDKLDGAEAALLLIVAGERPGPRGTPP